MEHLLRDFGYGLRQLRTSPSFTSVAVLTLALAIGATTAIFSVMYALIFRLLPVPRSPARADRKQLDPTSASLASKSLPRFRAFVYALR